VVFGKCARYRLARGDVARLVTGSGGGWGDPARRDRGLIQRDLRDEMITPDEARETYGLSGIAAPPGQTAADREGRR